MPKLGALALPAAACRARYYSRVRRSRYRRGCPSHPTSPSSSSARHREGSRWEEKRVGGRGRQGRMSVRLTSPVPNACITSKAGGQRKEWEPRNLIEESWRMHEGSQTFRGLESLVPLGRPRGRLNRWGKARFRQSSPFSPERSAREKFPASAIEANPACASLLWMNSSTSCPQVMQISLL